MISQKEEQNYLEMILVGNPKVGKSSLLLRFSDNIIVQNYQTTIGMDQKITNIDLNGKTINLRIRDSSGQERFKIITNSYYPISHGIILVYDVTDRQSFIDLGNWLADVDQYSNENVVKLLVGNKVDLEKQREVTPEEGQEYANSLNMLFIETSVKTKFNVNQVFQNLSDKIIQQDIANKKQNINKNE